MDRIKKVLSTECKGPRVLLACTGSVASIKIPLLIKEFQNKGAIVILLPTKSSYHFLINSEETPFSKKDLQDCENTSDKLSSNIQENKVSASYCNCGVILPRKNSISCDDCAIQQLYGDLPVATDALEWSLWEGRSDPVLHIELRRWADVLVIAPLSANTLAKIAGGLCDNLLTCVVRAWDMSKPLLFCPAMNTHMYDHPLTVTHIATLKNIGYTEVPCISKRLVCGDVGNGAMASVDTIVQHSLTLFNGNKHSTDKI